MNLQFMKRSHVLSTATAPLNGASIAVANPLGYDMKGRATTCQEASNSNPAGGIESNRIAHFFGAAFHGVLTALMVVMLLAINSVCIYAGGLPFTYDNISYEILSASEHTCNVRAQLSQPYEEDIVLPSTVYYKGEQYTVTVIGREAFKNCDKLLSVVIPNTVVGIGPYAFEDCENLCSVTMGKSVTFIETGAFEGCGFSEVEIPESVRSIGPYAFLSCKALASVSVPASVEYIGDNAFWNCPNLKSVRIEDSVDPIELKESIFEDTKIETLYLGRNYFCTSTVISKQPFARQPISQLEISEYVTEIPKYAFRFCEHLSSVTIPKYVTSIGEQAFAYSTITSPEFPESLSSIGKQAFIRCHNITSVEFPESLSSIGNEAFAECDNLTSVELPESLSSIGEKAFAKCYNLTSVELPESLSSIGKYAFWYCALETVKIPDSLTTLEEGVFSYTKIESVIIPKSIKTIRRFVFDSCSKLSLVKVSGPLEYIGAWAFGDCKNLRQFLCETPVPPVAVKAFESDYYYDNIYDQCILKVPASSINDYKSAEEWKYFKHIEPLDVSVNTYHIKDQHEGIISVYNLHGNLVMETPNSEDVDKLAPGIYIVNGKKIVIR